MKITRKLMKEFSIVSDGQAVQHHLTLKTTRLSRKNINRNSNKNENFEVIRFFELKSALYLLYAVL